MKNKPIEEKLKSIHFKGVSEEERDALWHSMLTKLEEPESSPSRWLQVKDKKMIPLIIGALLFVSAGGTVAASNNARPGDTLFNVDRAVENLQIKLSKDGRRAELKAKFAEERVKEAEEIRERSKTDAKAEAKIDLAVETALDFLDEVRADAEVNANAEAKAAVQRVIDRLEDVVNSDEVRARIQNGNLNLQIKGEEGGVRINTNGNKERIELRENGERIRVEIKKDGEIKVKTSGLLFGTTSTSTKERRDRDDDRDEDKIAELEIEVDIFTDKTVVKIEQGDRKAVFITSAKTKTKIMQEIVKRYPTLTLGRVESVIDIDVEDRASREDDLRI